MPLRVSLVNLQKLTLWAWVAPRQHADVGAGAEHAVLARAQHHHLHPGMLEAQPLHGVGEFDVDAEVVGIQLELIALEQPAILVDVHGQRRDVAVDGELPVPVARRIGLKIDVFRAASEDAIFTGLFAAMGHPQLFWIMINMHNNACLGCRLALKRPNLHFVSYRRHRRPVNGAAIAAGSAHGRQPAPSCRAKSRSTKSRRSHRASPPALRDAGNGRHRRCIVDIDRTIALFLARSRSGGWCRTGRPRPARSRPARGYRRDTRRYPSCGSSGSSQASFQPWKALSTSLCQRASFAFRLVVS